jgi:hypothetical protein
VSVFASVAREAETTGAMGLVDPAGCWTAWLHPHKAISV